ncbi:unnamed protein product [Polarella glacialis]|uniref:Amino acid transporter transmembrane domain-containing protein n=1 Tax=Polarella glacialis TaxID=89957 RepID=A0A813FQ23_POLGL|nr:unnamed protein product [Polarella glacialis]
MCLQNSLGALRFLCFASVACVCAVTGFIGWMAFSELGSARTVFWTSSAGGEESTFVLPQYRLFPKQWVDALYAIPVFGVSFLCHFNALPAHQELSRPTRMRIHRVVRVTMSFTTVLYALIGNMGYLFAADLTCGNVLLNFSVTDPGATAARCALGLVLTCNLPLLVLPAREALYSILQTMRRCCSASQRRDPLLSSATRSFTPQDGLMVVEATSRAEPSERLTTPFSRPSSSFVAPMRPAPQVHVYLAERHSHTRPAAVDAFQPKDEAVR